MKLSKSWFLWGNSSLRLPWVCLTIWRCIAWSRYTMRELQQYRGSNTELTSSYDANCQMWTHSGEEVKVVLDKSNGLVNLCFILLCCFNCCANNLPAISSKRDCAGIWVPFIIELLICWEPGTKLCLTSRQASNRSSSASLGTKMADSLLFSSLPMFFIWALYWLCV